ncbi:MAG: sialidase family protein, partial [Marinoscillum sp.]
MKNLILLAYLLSTTILFAQNTNLSTGAVFDGEPYLAINPKNSQHLVVAWMGWVNIFDRFKIKTRTSYDGGQTWSTISELPHTVNGYSSADPSLDFDQNGNVVACFIDFTGTTPPVTGGIYISKSKDGGLSWDEPIEVLNTNYDGTKWPIDRPWMVVDKSTGPFQGNIYITSMNLNRTNAPFKPYLSVSNDAGNTFTQRHVDTTGWLAGSINPFPMCSPTISSSGVFYGAYPSYALTQSLYIQTFLTTSSDGGKNLNHGNINIFPHNSFPSDSLAKKGTLLLSNPADPNHLAYVHLRTDYGDMDVYLIESMDAGATWSAPVRINDDPPGNDRMQDLLWADFDSDGDLIISWRDRRNGSDSTYQTETEIWAAFRDKHSHKFKPNFQISSQLIDYTSDMEEAGNDFMCVKLQNDTLNAVWGDPRDGELNIWFQQMTTNGTVLSTNQISSETIPPLIIYPNPTNS